MLADGVSLGEYGYYGQGTWDVPAAATNSSSSTSCMRWQRGELQVGVADRRAETRWKWKSSAADAGKPLPLLFPDYDLAVDLNDRAPKVAGYPDHDHGRRGRVVPAWPARGGAGQASYDDGATWAEVPVMNYGHKVVALVDNTAADRLRDPQG